MYSYHPDITFDITTKVRGLLTQETRHKGLTHLYFINEKGERIRVPSDALKVFDKTVRSKHDPRGHRMTQRDLLSGPSCITLCTTQSYEVYWKDTLVADLNFTWRITPHRKKSTSKKSVPKKKKAQSSPPTAEQSGSQESS